MHSKRFVRYNYERRNNMTNTNDMPKVELDNLYNSLVNVPTQKLYDRLMKIYECGGWTWSDGKLPTECLMFIGQTTYVHGCNLFEETDNPEKYRGLVKMTVNDFCKTQNIDELKMGEINKWFRDNKPNRSSLGQRLI
jgi:hypothetical protein